MIITEQKDLSEILESIEPFRNIFITGCGECAAACKTGGEEEVRQMSQTLKHNGFNVTGTTVIEEACHVLLTKRVYREHAKEIGESDCVLVMSCGAGVQATALVLDIPAIPALNSLFLGDTLRFGQFEEYCSMCGQCVLATTGGICPVTRCPKGLLNGPCGGVDNNGMCEVDRTRKCAWVEIYERLKNTGRVESLRRIVPPKDFSRSRHPSRRDIRKTENAG